MPTLAMPTPWSRLADILHAAMAMGPDSWNANGPSANRPFGSPSELSNDLLGLFSLLRDRQIQYLLVGGVAMLKYIDGRNTEDVDLLLSASSLKAIPEITIAEKKSRIFARGNFRNLRVDLLLTANPLFKLAQEKFATAHEFGQIHVPCATVEGLILLKLYALPSLYRQGDMQRAALYETDITMLVQRYRPPTSPILDILKSHVDEDSMRERQTINSDIHARILRMDQARLSKSNRA